MTVKGERSWRRLLVAFSDASPGFRDRFPEERGGSSWRRFLGAFSDVRPAGEVATPARGPSLVCGTGTNLVVLALLGAVLTLFTARAVNTTSAGVVAVLILLIALLLVLPFVVFLTTQLSLIRRAGRLTASPGEVERLLERNAAAFAQVIAPGRTAGGTGAGAVPEMTEPAAGGFWDTLSPAERRELRALGAERTYPPGAVLMRQGDSAASVVIIRSGLVRITAGRELEIAVRGPGDVVGERAMARPRIRTATVAAVTAVRALAVPGDAFAAFTMRHPRVRTVLERQLYARRTEHHEPVPEAELAGLERRIAASVGGLAGNTPGTLPMTVGELAGWISVPPAVLRHILAGWERRGLVRVDPGGIDVRAPERLRNLAGEPRDENAPQSWAGQECAVILATIEGTDRTDADHAALVDVFYDTLRGALKDVSIPWEALHLDDPGDGVLIVAPPQIPAPRLLGPLMARLAARVAGHNALAEAPRRFHLRVAIDLGPVVSHARGVSGAPIVGVARLIEAPAPAAPAAEPPDLALIVTESAYRAVVAHGADAAEFSRADLRVRSARLTGWIRFY